MAVRTPTHPAPSRWSRSYPPLALLALAVLIAAFILPSSLNLPQTNPSTVLEYAPVPPEDDEPNPPPGNVSSLGLGSSGTLSVGGQPPPPPPPARKDKGATNKALSKKCVGTPPRQTEDPNAPPCVPYFDGDNFGVTYQGVTKDEILVLVYWDDGIYSDEPIPSGYIDIGEPPKRRCAPRDTNPATCDNPLVRATRALGYYFNDRFQSYARSVHYIGFVSGATTDSARRADAVDNWTKYKPFAVLDQATFQGHNQAYVDAMAARGVMVFSSLQALPRSLFQKNAPMMWGFWPDVEHWADLYTTYVCTRVAGFRVEHSGNPPGGSGTMNGKERKFGVFYTTDQGRPDLRLFAQYVIEGIKGCGITNPVEATYPKANFIVDNSDSGASQATSVSKFKGEQVTTILWLGGVESKFTKAAHAQGYYPEIVFAGDLDLDNNANGRLQQQEVWQNAWGTQFNMRIDRLEDAPGYKAFKEADPNGPAQPDGLYARDLYRDHFHLFQGIQAAGPDLTPESIDKGFHAFPPQKSTNPYTAAFYFDPGDYSGVKDSMEVWWDPDGTGQGGTVESGSTRPGCMRMTRGGLRYLAGKWPRADEVFDVSREDPCTAYGGSFKLRPA